MTVKVKPTPAGRLIIYKSGACGVGHCMQQNGYNPKSVHLSNLEAAKPHGIIEK
jgi:hypothetical protein